MKKGAIIGISIAVVVVGLVSTLSMPFSSVSKKCNDNYTNVIGDNVSDYDTKINKIAMLGAHDAFTSGINYKSTPNTNEGGLFNNKIVNIVAKGLATRMSKAQTANAEELLNAGVRYLDVRITNIDNEYYTMHGYLSNKLEYYLSDVINFLEDNPKEFVIFDVQHFYTADNSNWKLDDSAYTDLWNYIATVKSEGGKSLFDFVRYNAEDTEIKDLTYGTVTNNGSEGGVVILAKNDSDSRVYPRDNDGTYNNNYYFTVRSVWHKDNYTKSMIDAIEYEYDFLKENDYSDVLVVNQAQKTGFLTNAKIINGILSWSLLDMANSFNKKLVSDKDRFQRWLTVMPIFMVDYATSNTGDFNKLANEYISEYNQTL